MLLNEGKFNDKRLLSRKSVELIRTARADIDKNSTDDFGLGFYVTELSETGELGSNGSYSWSGAFNTYFWIDPKEKLIGVLMTQVRPAKAFANIFGTNFRVHCQQADRLPQMKDFESESRGGQLVPTL